MKIYIATFYSHFGAIRFKKQCDKEHWNPRIMPVPRALSSSCGTCVQFECETPPIGEPYEEMEQIVALTDSGYQVVYRAKNS